MFLQRATYGGDEAGEGGKYHIYNYIGPGAQCGGYGCCLAHCLLYIWTVQVPGIVHETNQKDNFYNFFFIVKSKTS